MAAADVYSQRFKWLIKFFVIWAAVLTVRLFYFSIVSREEAITKMEESLEKRQVKALRGRILSIGGKVLVESKRTSRLILNSEVTSSQLNGLLGILEKELGVDRRQVMIKLAQTPSNNDVVLKENLSMEDIQQFSKVIGVNRILFLEMKFSRQQYVKTRSALLGEVDENGKGLSGFEKKYDANLRGQDLVYEVLIDKKGEAILKTFNELQKHEPGQDVYLTKEEWP